MNLDLKTRRLVNRNESYECAAWFSSFNILWNKNNQTMHCHVNPPQLPPSCDNNTFSSKKQKQNRNVIPRAVGSWGLSWDPSFFSFFEKLKDVLPCLRPPLPLGFSQHYDACIWTHFPTELKQCRKFAQRSDICFPKPRLRGITRRPQLDIGDE